jgi:hypothetical protein
VYNQQGQNAGVVSGNLASVLKALRSALFDCSNVCGWVAGQAELDLVNIGFNTNDVTQMQDYCTKLLVLIQQANGGPPPTETINYVDLAIPLIGPQT